MAIDKLNFSGINSGSGDIVSPVGSLADRLMKYGNYMVTQGNEEERLKLQQDKDAYQRGRDAITDARYDEQQLKADAEKNRLIGKEINTANAMQAIYNPDEYKSLRMSSEQKAIQDTLANATPEDRLQMQQELKGYDPKSSGQQWVGTAIGQSNVDSSKLADLRINMDKQSADEKYRQDSIALQREQNAISAGARADQRRLDERKLILEENKLNAPKKEDVKAAETRKGLYREFKLNELKIPDSSLTNDQLENILKEEKQKISDIKKEKKELEKSGSFPFEEGKSISDQRKEFLSKNLLGTEGITTNDMNNYLKEDMNNIDRFLLDAEIKLGKKYNEKDILNRIASERKNQKIASPWDTRIQDALETVSEQIGLGETDY